MDMHIFTVKVQFQKTKNMALTQVRDGTRTWQSRFSKELGRWEGQCRWVFEEQGWSIYRDRVSEMSVLS